jgi:hypothetical protein
LREDWKYLVTLENALAYTVDLDDKRVVHIRALLPGGVLPNTDERAFSAYVGIHADALAGLEDPYRV